MSHQNGLIDSTSLSVEPPTAWLSQLFITKLGDVGCSNPHGISVMLAIVSAMSSEGAVVTPQAKVAHMCGITIQSVRDAIAKLANFGLLSGVDISPEPDGVVACFVSPEFVRFNEPEDVIIRLGVPAVVD